VASYTAEELAEKARLSLGASISPRTIYFYRQIGLLSPLAASGSQPGFGERHFLELAAALALQRAPDRPTLADIAVILRGLSETELAALARSLGPPVRELVSGGPCPRVFARGGHSYVAEGRFCDPPPGASLPSGATSLPLSVLPGGTEGIGEAPASLSQPISFAASPARSPGAVTITLAPGVTLHLGAQAPQELVTRLLTLALDYAGGGEAPLGASSSGGGAES
jgi:DNA-binding transcriptional MerR regulator